MRRHVVIQVRRCSFALVLGKPARMIADRLILLLRLLHALAAHATHAERFGRTGPTGGCRLWLLRAGRKRLGGVGEKWMCRVETGTSRALSS